MALPDDNGVSLTYLEGPPDSNYGSTFGVPWSQGELYASKTKFSCLDADDNHVAVQTWVAAYWPDESIKWTSHAIPGSDRAQEGYRIIAEHIGLEKHDLQSDTTPALLVIEQRLEDDCIKVHTGKICAHFPTSGNVIVSKIVNSYGRIVGQNGRLVLLSQDCGDNESQAGGLTSNHSSVGTISKTTVESSGPIRTVIKVEGKHVEKSTSSDVHHEPWLPFVFRFYLHANSASIKIMHTTLYDGDAESDFIRGIGLSFEIPLNEEHHFDRHIRISGAEGGIFSEAVQGITGLRKDPGEEVRKSQVEGRATPPIETWDQDFISRLKWVPSWNDYSLSQLSPDGFTLRKRTERGKAWVNIPGGTRASGLVYLGGANTGGIALGMKDFWERYPTGIDIRNAGKDVGELTLWLYSPSAQPMNLSAYHDGLGQDTNDQQLDALTMTYEDWEEKTGSPYGIARTNEIHLFAFDATPESSVLGSLSSYIRQPPMLIPDSDLIFKTKALGRLWSPKLRDSRGHEQEQCLDKNLDFLFEFYKGQIEQRRWYGFWDYGDIMHTYDEDRHQWRYDIGGYAWDNSELSPDIWLWLYFLRTRRSDVYRMAEALTRHTGEVDVYHLGQYKGTGTRHGVQHWSDSCKQLRISNALYRRIFYYLSGADERTGDLLTEVLDAEDTFLHLDPYRKVRKDKSTYQPKADGVSLSLGTDWSALAAAWFIEMERHGKRANEAKEKLFRTMKGIGALKNGFITGMATYSLETAEITPPAQDPGNLGHVQVSHLSAMFGLAEICAEIIASYGPDLPAGFEDAWLQYCLYFNASADDQVARFGTSFANLQLRQGHSRLTAYAAHKLSRSDLARRAWIEFFTGDGYGPDLPWVSDRVEGSVVLSTVDEAPWISTNITALYGLAAIQNLSLISEELRKDDFEDVTTD